MRSLLKREKQSLKEWAVAHKMRSYRAFFEWVKFREEGAPKAKVGHTISVQLLTQVVVGGQ